MITLYLTLYLFLGGFGAFAYNVAKRLQKIEQQLKKENDDGK